MAFSNAENAYAADNTDIRQSIRSDSKSTTLSPASVQKTYLSKKKMSIAMAGGDATTIGVNNTGSKVRWANSDSSIVLVKPSGAYAVNVTALKPGKATVTVKNSTQTLTCQIQVTGALSKRSLEMTTLQTSRLTLAGAAAKRWSSSNSDVVKVDTRGGLEPQSTGKATITCTDSKNRRYTCSVSVKCPAISCSTGLASVTTIGRNSFYVRKFNLDNNSGKDIVLDKGRIIAYPKLSALGACKYCGFDSASKAYFDAKPVTVKHAQGYHFNAISANGAALASHTSFKMHFKAGNAHFCGAFRSTGAMFACRRTA